MNKDWNGRIKSVDAFKGLAIVAIVIVHLIMLPSGANTDRENMPVLAVLYSGLVLFFFVAGYFSHYERPFVENAKNRLLKLLLVTVLGVFILTGIMAAFMYAYGYPVTWESIYNATVNYFLTGGGKSFVPYEDWKNCTYELCFVANGYYFLFVMFFSLLVFYCLSWWSMKNGKRVALTIAALLILNFFIFYEFDFALPFFFQIVPISAAFVFLGAYASKRDFYGWIDNGWKKKEYWIIFGIVFAVALILDYLFPSHFGFHRSFLGDYPGWSVFSFFAASVAGGYCVCVICSVISKIKYVGDLFSFVGKFSLAIYMLHTMFIKILTANFYEYTTDLILVEMPPGAMIVAGFFAIVLSILTAMFVHYLICLFRKHSGQNVDVQ